MTAVDLQGPDALAAVRSELVMQQMRDTHTQPRGHRHMLDGGIFVGGWPLIGVLGVLVIGIIGIGFVIGVEIEAVPATAALTLACGSAFTATMTDKLFDIRRRDYMRVSQGRATADEIDRLDRIHPKPETLRARKRYAVTGAVIGIAAVATAGWWAHHSLTDAAVAGLIAVVVTLLAAVLGSLAPRRTS